MKYSNEVSNYAVEVYVAARCELRDDAGNLTPMAPAEAAAATWTAIREACPTLRAPYWDEKVNHNGSSMRDYVSPLGEVLGGELAWPYGSHSAKWPRTQRSLHEAEARAAQVLAYLEECVVRYARIRAEERYEAAASEQLPGGLVLQEEWK